MIQRLPIVGVMGSGVDPWADRAEPLGRWLAGQGVHLLTGGGSGVMAAVSRAFVGVAGRHGLSIGILPSADHPGAPREGYPDASIEVPIRTHLPRTGDQGEDPMSRNHINILSATVIVALPGGPGTASEVRLAVGYRRPIIGYLRDRAEIPDLPDEVPVSGTLSGVQAFVASALRIA
jgi:uncharacterized protein (TIGR00725 family)